MAQHWLWLYAVDTDRLGRQFEPVSVADPSADPFDDTEALTDACAAVSTAQAQIGLALDPRATPVLARLLDERDDAPGLPQADPANSWLGPRSPARTTGYLAELRNVERTSPGGLNAEEREQLIKFLALADGSGRGFVVFHFS